MFTQRGDIIILYNDIVYYSVIILHSGMRHCHDNNVFSVDVINKVVYNNDISNN